MIINRKITWALLKAFVQARTLSVQYIDLGSSYILWAYDGESNLQYEMDKDGGTDQTDFETNFMPTGNASSSDIDGIPFFRLKASKKGWSFWALPIELTTSTLGGTLYAKDSLGNNIPGITCKIYDGNNNEITTAGLLNANLNTCVKTVMDFEPAFDYEMIGGALRINSNPGQDVRLWIVGAPDIPANLGGSKEFASGVNLKFLAPDSAFEIDGRVTKYVTYSAVTHSGKLRAIILHPAGLQVNMQMVIQTYRL